MTDYKPEKTPPPASAASANERSMPCEDSSDALKKAVAGIRRLAPPRDKSQLVIDGNWPGIKYPDVVQKG